MHLLAHFTMPEGLVLAGVFVLGVVSGSALTWVIAVRWLQRNR